MKLKELSLTGYRKHFKMALQEYSGILPINKPVGMTSHDVVLKVRQALGKRLRVGHTGTLDPLAKGLLLLCLGKSTKTARFLNDCKKTYVASIRLGQTSVTYDAEGIEPDLTPKEIPEFTSNELRKMLIEFTGLIQQRVPIYSAVRVNGDRLYKRARRGEDVESPIRDVNIFSIDLLKYMQPDISLRITCSSGTYIRSLAHDIGERLGCGGYLLQLTRISIGSALLEGAITVEDVNRLNKEERLNDLLMPVDAVIPYSYITITPDFYEHIRNGRQPTEKDISDVHGDFTSGDRILVKDRSGNLLAVGRAAIDSGKLGQRAEQPILTFERVLV